MGNVVISANLKKTRDRINLDGSVIDPRTKQVIAPNRPEYVPTAAETARAVAPQVAPEPAQAPVAHQAVGNDPLDILDQIKQAKARLKDLEELKKLKIKEKKAELELLEQ